MRTVFIALVFAISISTRIAAANESVDAGSETPAEILARAEHGNTQTRKECEQMLIILGETAVPSLIVSSKQSTTESMRKFCEDVLDEMGKRTAADDVQTTTDEALIGVFSAFAQTKDVDAVSAIFPFVGSDRLAIRTASREALRAYGDTIHSRLRAEYINIGGQIPGGIEPTTAQLLDGYLAMRDRLRLQDVTALFDKALGEAKTDLPTAIIDLDASLAREPLLERRKEAAPIYVQYAHELAKADPKATREYDLKAIRIAEAGSADIDRAQSEIAFLDAEDLRARGIVDRNGYAHALALDPQNQDAQDALAAIDAEKKSREDKLRRTEAAIAAAVAVTAVFIAGLVAFLRRRRS